MTTQISNPTPVGQVRMLVPSSLIADLTSPLPAPIAQRPVPDRLAFILTARIPA